MIRNIIRTFLSRSLKLHRNISEEGKTNNFNIENKVVRILKDILMI